MRNAGKTRQEIAEALRLTKKQIKNWMNCHNKKEVRSKAGIPPKVLDRKAAMALQELQQLPYPKNNKLAMIPLSCYNSTDFAEFA